MTADGKYINGFSDDDFNTCMYASDTKVRLAPGQYIIALDATWNDSASRDSRYQDVLLDIYGPSQVSISQINPDQGLKVLTKSLKSLAESYSEEQGTKKFYLEHDEDYGKSVYKVSELSKATKCRFGFCYTQNKSRYPLKETLSVNLKGAELFWPKSAENGLFEIDLKPNEDGHIVIFKQVEDRCSYGYRP